MVALACLVAIAMIVKSVIDKGGDAIKDQTTPLAVLGVIALAGVFVAARGRGRPSRVTIDTLGKIGRAPG